LTFDPRQKNRSASISMAPGAERGTAVVHACCGKFGEGEEEEEEGRGGEMRRKNRMRGRRKRGGGRRGGGRRRGKGLR
jgi:hypothetical protein